jgi:hypothetical protein
VRLPPDHHAGRLLVAATQAAAAAREDDRATCADVEAKRWCFHGVLSSPGGWLTDAWRLVCALTVHPVDVGARSGIAEWSTESVIHSSLRRARRKSSATGQPAILAALRAGAPCLTGVRRAVFPALAPLATLRARPSPSCSHSSVPIACPRRQRLPSGSPRFFYSLRVSPPPATRRLPSPSRCPQRRLGSST